MKRYIAGKIFLVFVIIAPLFAVHSCKKQEKCGCDGDLLFSIPPILFEYPQIQYTENGGTMWFTQGNDTYYFCNPKTMYSTYQGLSPDEQILVSGDVYWDCNYVSSAGQSYYSYYYKSYNINVTEMKSYLYGK